MILNGLQIAQLAYKAGFRGEALNIAVAVALAESGGNTQAYNPEIAANTPDGSGSRGLWQIYGVAHPEYNNDSAFNPQVNAQAAYKVFREAGNRFTPWSTYNAGMANPKQDYAKALGNSSLGGFLLNTVRGQNNTRPQATNKPNQLSNSLLSQMGGGTTKQESTPEQIASAITGAVTGGRSASDITVYFLGGFLIVVAIIFLLLGTETGREVGKAAIAAAV